MNIFEQVKGYVTAGQAAEQYGIKINRNKMACCPFHNDRHPSMKVDKTYHCFACNAGGDAIDFTARLFGLSQFEAAKKLIDDFGLPIQIYKKESKTIQEYRKPEFTQEQKVIRLEKKFGQWLDKTYRLLIHYRSWLRTWKVVYAPNSEDEKWHPLFTEALEKEAVVEYYLDILWSAEAEELKDFFMEKREVMSNLEKRLNEYERTLYREFCGSTGGRDADSG